MAWNEHDEDSADDLRQITLRARAGDPAAKAVIYTRFYPGVLAIHLAATGGDRHLAADLTQDTFAKALYRLDQFEWRGSSSLRGWIGAIARNTFRDHVRSAAQRHHGGYDVPDREDPDEGTDPQAVTERDDPATKDRTARMLRLLKPDHQFVLIRMVGEGSSAAEVARELGRSEAAVHQLKRRALSSARRFVAGTSAPDGDGPRGPDTSGRNGADRWPLPL